ncbi:hypothetical protein J3T99_09105 [Acetobacteraceae bacterium B3987]|nr:hypothetical protein [Acetobacteraceae bacterium B3987]
MAFRAVSQVEVRYGTLGGTKSRLVWMNTRPFAGAMGSNVSIASDTSPARSRSFGRCGV